MIKIKIHKIYNLNYFRNGEYFETKNLNSQGYTKICKINEAVFSDFWIAKHYTREYADSKFNILLMFCSMKNDKSHSVNPITLCQALASGIIDIREKDMYDNIVWKNTDCLTEKQLRMKKALNNKISKMFIIY